jgi:hypothetical protein
MLLEVCFISVEHPIEPREEFVSAVVGVQNNGTKQLS